MTAEKPDRTPEFPELSETELAKARPFSEVFPQLAASIRRGRGKQRAPTKVRVTLRVDRETVEAFRADGRGWQSRMNEALRKAAGGG